MSEKHICLNQSKMLDFYKGFDPVSFKYKILLKQEQNEDDRLNAYLKWHQYEEERQFAELTRKEFWHLQENLDMAYANHKITDSFLDVYDLICEKIVRNYIHIDGMERLFSEKYSEFEWEMHLGIDFKKHSMDFYRDHFIHQVKDAYSMVKLLEEGGFYEKVQRFLSNEGSSKIARYVNKLIEQQLRLPLVVPCGNSKEKYGTELLKEHFMYNIIYMSSYIAGLFHDIGYPAAASLENSQRMVDYLVEMHHFEQGGYDFRQIMSLLQNSLLFRIVSPQEIRGRIEGAKVDHGTMSALLFLLHFYENGAIHRLEPYKLCAVELAALAIYNHTNDYTYVGDKDAAYERPVFALDPISYLLRICDDLQEWGRIYFEVSNKSNMIICKNCRMPIIQRRIKDAKEGYEGDYDVDYHCSCRSESDENGLLFAPMFRYKQFSYRRVYNITVCREVEIKTEKPYRSYYIHIKYDLDRLLHIAYINPDYAKYRIKELTKLKRFFPRQDTIELVYLDYFVTANILLIKSVIVGQYLRLLINRTAEEKKQDILNVFKELEDEADTVRESTLDEATRKKLYTKIKTGCDMLFTEYNSQIYETYLPRNMSDAKGKEYAVSCEEYFHKTFYIYIFVYLLNCVGETINTKGQLKGEEFGEELQKILDQLMQDEELGTDLVGDHEIPQNLLNFCSEEVTILLKDCCVQAGRKFANLNSYPYYPDSYFSTYHSEDVLYSAVKRFIDTERYCPMSEKKKEEMQLDAYSDLYSVRVMLKELMDCDPQMGEKGTKVEEA